MSFWRSCFGRCCEKQLRSDIELKLSKKESEQKGYRGTVVGANEKLLKRFFQHVRYLSDIPLSEDELNKSIFFVKRQRVNELILMCRKLKVASHEDMKAPLENVEKLSIRLEGVRGRRGSGESIELNNEIAEDDVRDILSLATFVEASTNFGYEDFEKAFKDDFTPAIDDILSVKEDGVMSDSVPTNSKILGVNFQLSGILNDDMINMKFVREPADHELLIILIPSQMVLRENFEDYLINYKSYISPCLTIGGPSLVFLLTNVEKAKAKHKQVGGDWLDKIEESTRRIVEFSCKVVDDEDRDLAQLQLPLVTFVELKDLVRFKIVMHEIARRLSGVRDSKRKSVFLNERESFYS